MGCFQIDLNSPLELLFYGLSLLQAIRAVQLAGAIRKDWSGFRQPPLTLPKMRLVEQGAYLLAIPLLLLCMNISMRSPFGCLAGGWLAAVTASIGALLNKIVCF